MNHRAHRAPSLLLALVLLGGAALSGCTGEDPEATRGEVTSSSGEPPSSAEPPSAKSPAASIGAVPNAQWNKMVETGMVRPGCPVTRRAQLRRVDLPYIDFAGETQRGHIIVHRDTAESVSRIFMLLYEQGFPIASMQGVENYGGDSNASLKDNNTAAYNCRRLDQINAPPTESPHANGRAVDINPLQNPWMDLRCKCWSPSPENKKRTPGPGKITRKDEVWQAFKTEGWIWQNIKVPDYMHFDTGYPSAPLKAPQER